MAKKPVAEYYMGMPKGERAARAFFHEQALELMEVEFKLVAVEREGARCAGLGPQVTLTAMTDAGRLNIRVCDDEITTDFELPKDAMLLLPCNFYSGKWNHHAFLSRSTHGKEAEQRWAPEFLLGLLRQVSLGLERVNARPWVETPVSVTATEALTLGWQEMKRRVAMGTAYTITEWDRAAESAYYAANVTDVYGNRSAEFVENNLWYNSRRTDVEVFFDFRQWLLHAEGKTA